MSKLVLFSLLLMSIGTPFFTATAAEKSPVSDRAEVKITSQTAKNSYNLDPNQVENSSKGDDLCFNIHAFIFKTDDNQVPRLVGETTCMRSSGAKTKKIDRFVQPKLVPLTGGNAF